jgi:hypothetical protein
MKSFIEAQDVEDDRLLLDRIDQFEQCQLPQAQWTHEMHLAVALIYVQRWPESLALETMRDRIQRYNQSCGNPGGYHETITVLFIRRLAVYCRDRISTESPSHQVLELAAQLNLDWLLSYYSKERLWSEIARATFVEPDRRLLDF